MTWGCWALCFPLMKVAFCVSECIGWSGAREGRGGRETVERKRDGRRRRSGAGRWGGCAVGWRAAPGGAGCNTGHHDDQPECSGKSWLGLSVAVAEPARGCAHSCRGTSGVWVMVRCGRAGVLLVVAVW